MTKIQPAYRLSLQEIQQSIRKSVTKQQLKDWMTFRPARMFTDLALGWIAIAAAFLFVTHWQTWWGYLVAVLLIGAAQYALFIMGHDAIHYTLHPQREVNDNVSKWLIHGPMCMGFEDGRRSHLKHHRLLGTAEDPDRYIHRLSDKNSPVRFLLFCSGLATFGKTVLKVTPFGRLLSGDNKSTAKSVEKTSSVLFIYVRDRIPAIVAQLILIGAILWIGLPVWAYFALWIAPIYFFVFLPDEIRAFCDHAVKDIDDDRADPDRLISYHPSLLEALFLAPHNMHFHAEHHLWPSIPYYNLPSAHAAIKSDPHITVRGSYLPFLWSLFVGLPLDSKHVRAHV
ncbi:MAG: fatty acid desaturase [Rhodocyclaceae bacterium]|nr:fatty acid desaturase [Rhodocyclaceae bacterium]